MSGKLEFREKLSGILAMAESQNNIITLQEVERYFEEDMLSPEQVDLVCDYLLSQKAAVKGYEKRAGVVTEREETEEKLSLGEQTYVAEYLAELSAVTMEDERMRGYLIKVAELARRMPAVDVFIGDLIQEGNLNLIVAMEQYGESPDEEQDIMEAVRLGMQAMVENQAESGRRDKRLVEQAAELDEKIKCLAEEMGREVSVDEVAQFMDMSEEQIKGVLKLLGEGEE